MGWPGVREAQVCSGLCLADSGSDKVQGKLPGLFLMNSFLRDSESASIMLCYLSLSLSFFSFLLFFSSWVNTHTHTQSIEDVDWFEIRKPQLVPFPE